ncbi:hypothetical protein Anas_12112 [Armadillidium nasatum]|uniref:Uncharacterized protein n=1 Tax=Armadillidium nasatum TaxID=96803 RepID=A0A5N5TC39_9CRUS|nr:hypothetical protein Anas_12112 [Armadillidium nasatum]
MHKSKYMKPLVQSKTNNTHKSEEDVQNEPSVKKRGRPKKESKMETSDHDEEESLSSIVVKAEKKEKKGKQPKRKLSKEDEPLVQSKTNNTHKSEDVQDEPSLKKRGRPKKESKMETSDHDEEESLSSIVVKAEKKEKKGKQPKRKLSKEG